MAWPRLLRPFFKKSQVFGYKFSNLPLHFKNFLLSFSICFPCVRLFQLPAYAAKYKCEEQNNEGGNDKPLAFSQLSNIHDQELFTFLIQYKPFTVRPDGKRLLRNLFWERVKTNVLTTVKFVKALSSHANRGMIFRRAAVFSQYCFWFTLKQAEVGMSTSQGALWFSLFLVYICQVTTISQSGVKGGLP